MTGGGEGEPLVKMGPSADFTYYLEVPSFLAVDFLFVQEEQNPIGVRRTKHESYPDG